MPSQLVLGQWVCISLYVAVCFVLCVCVCEVFRASEFQQACQVFTISYLVLFARLHLLLF